MIKIFQKRWLNIEFSEFCQPTHKFMADTTFYKRFYEIFYKKYSGWGDLPSAYLRDKHRVANHLAKVITENNMQTVLSIGCGNGIIEKELIERLPNLQLFAYEPDEINFKWLKNISNINLCAGSLSSCLSSKKYDLVYLSGVDPVLSNTEYLGLLIQIKRCTSAPLMLTNVIKPYRNILVFISYWTKFLFFKLSLYDLGQFWGYLRYFYEHQRIFSQAGYTVINKGSLSKGFMWIEIAPDKHPYVKMC